jgi:hypothetical protein
MRKAAGAPPSLGLLLALVAQVRGKSKTPAIGVHLAVPWTGPPELEAGGEHFVHCPSPLAFRVSLAGHEGEPVVLLTERSENELGADVLARLARRRLIHLNAWGALRDRLGVRDVDPRLRDLRWLPDHLLALGAEELPRPTTQVLDADDVWQALLARLGLADPRPDLRALLEWTATAAGLAAFLHLPAEARDDYASRISASAGGAARGVLHLVAAGRGGEAVAAGLICEVLFAADAAASADAADAARGAGRFEERLLGGAPLAPADGRAWAQAAGEVARHTLAEGTGAAFDPALAQAQRLAEELRIEVLAEERSTWLPRAFARRLQDFAAALTPWLERPEAAGLPALAAAAAAVRNHGMAAVRAPDECAVETLLRLGRWLAAAVRAAPAGSFAEAAAAYAREGSWVDLARAELTDLQGLTAPLAFVRDRLLAAVGAQREAEGKRFAQLLASWSEAPSETAALVPAESILERVVAPLAESGPVLLLVLDGLSFAIFRALAPDLMRRGWEEITPAAAPGTPATAAAGRAFGVGLLPTVTEVCRTSLFCGEPRKGTQATEKTGFAAHPALRRQGAANRPPMLFHKGDLRGKGAGLEGEIKDELERSAQRVVGVVLNAVDDQLPKGGQLVPRWEVAALRPLDEILEAALNAGRAVVLTADHGHLVERGTELRRREGGGARHRWAGAASPPVTEGEIAVRGPRVLGGEGGGAILAWSERLRYGTLQNGYHGGASPQEVIVPLSVWVPFDTARPGWQPAPQDEPAWWREDVVPAAPAVTAPAEPAPPEALPPSPKGRAKPARAEGQGTLFSPPAVSPPPPPVPAAAAPAPREPWLALLFASPVYREQLARAGRQGVTDEQVAGALTALARQGGGTETPQTMPVALANQLGLSLPRLHGLLAALQRVLNVEGFPVLVFNPESERVILDRALLAKQFLAGETAP